MKTSKMIAVLVLMLASSVAYIKPVRAQSTFDLKQMRDYFAKRIADGPYIYLQSPRTGLGVGTVYSIVDGQTLFYSRPEDCFSQSILDKAHTSKLAVSNLNITGQFTWQLGLRVANAGPITD